MTVTNIDTNRDAKTMTVFAEFAAPVERVWRLWEDPRQLERWWGPPGYPATVVDFDLRPDGRVNYFMTSPEGDKYGGWWQIVAVDPPNRLEFEDGFSDSSGEPNLSMPTTNVVVEFAAKDGGATMTIRSTYSSIEDLEKVLEMGVVEGMTLALGQIEALLAEDAA